MAINFSEDTHRRYNILTGEWVLVSPHRNKRPWQGKVEKLQRDNRPSYDAHCYLCPGNKRASGDQTPVYDSVFVFSNDFAAIKPDNSSDVFAEGLLHAKGERGTCRVVCFSPDHSLTIPQMTIDALVDVVRLWKTEYQELGSRPYINHVQIFENKGAIMGCSNPHPHGQIWAQQSIPVEAFKKGQQQLNYWKKHEKSLLETYLQQELELGERIICENDNFVALTPFWAVWPYEAMIIPRRHLQHIGQFNAEEEQSFAAILKDLTQRFDRIFDTSFPYSSGIHQAPTDGEAHEEWHFHMAFYPPLLRSATVKKFMVGYEMFGEPQRDITAEQAAQRMRKLI